ncbi:VOC family protein [Halegenticoccus soli]|uniref:VOC family protein n=1 Tax=Halegenticoccus soli TaxID=1985678 RepID=UPI000C6ECD15|nr:VOC family protein [Halegenticoccus soli]
MRPEIPALDVEIPEISQIAFVVEEIEDGMDRFGSVLGVDTWQLYRFEPPTLTDTTYRGEPHDYSMVLALTEVGGTMLELIEPLEGESIYTEHLEEHGEGLHHVACFAFDDPEAVIEEFEDAGMPVLQSGVYADVPYWYFDTQEQLNGVIFETADNVDAIPEPDDTYTASP